MDAAREGSRGAAYGGAVAGLAEDESLRVRIALNHEVWVLGASAETINAAVARHAALGDAPRSQGRVVACPGTRWCARGLTDAPGLADLDDYELDVLDGLNRPGELVVVNVGDNRFARRKPDLSLTGREGGTPSIHEGETPSTRERLDQAGRC